MTLAHLLRRGEGQMKLSETARFWVDLATIVALGVALWMGHPVGVDETASSAPATMTTR